MGSACTWQSASDSSTSSPPPCASDKQPFHQKENHFCQTDGKDHSVALSRPHTCTYSHGFFGVVWLQCHLLWGENNAVEQRGFHPRTGKTRKYNWATHRIWTLVLSLVLLCTSLILFPSSFSSLYFSLLPENARIKVRLILHCRWKSHWKECEMTSISAFVSDCRVMNWLWSRKCAWLASVPHMSWIQVFRVTSTCTWWCSRISWFSWRRDKKERLNMRFISLEMEVCMDLVYSMQ